MSDLNSTIIQESEPVSNPQVKIDYSLYKELKYLGIIHDHDEKDIRSFNVGNSDYSKHLIQPWTIWQAYNLNAWDADIVKRVLRTKEEPGMPFRDSRIMDYNKIIHICKERIRQLESEPEYTYTSTTIRPRGFKTEESEPSITYQLKGSELNSYLSFIAEHQKTCKGNRQDSLSTTALQDRRKGKSSGMVSRLERPGPTPSPPITSFRTLSWPPHLHSTNTGIG